MRNLLLLIIFILPLSIFSQDSYLADLPISGGVSEIGVSPSERIWIATKAGNTYYTDKIGELWHIGPFGSLDTYNIGVGKTFERVNFFDESTLMISGFIQEGGKQDFVFRSTDEGKTWDKVKFGKSSWIDAAYINENGKAWMSGNSQLIYYTENKGKTWKSFDKAGNENALRFATIHFDKDEKTGLFGSFWNVLYKTTDNCISWERLPTPLDQKKYKRLSKEHRPDIRKIRIFGDYYIINQQGKIFYSNKKNLDWNELSQIVDFEVTEDESIYLIDKSLKVILKDSLFNTVFTSEKSLNATPIAINTKNNSLFALTGSMIYKIDPQTYLSTELLTNEVPIPEPYLKVESNSQLYGFNDKDVLIYKIEENGWKRFMELPISVSNVTKIDEKTILQDSYSNNNYVIDFENKVIESFELPKTLIDLSKIKVIEFSIEEGSQGCFHSERHYRSYKLKGDEFVLENRNGNFLRNMNRKISPESIQEIIREINYSKDKSITKQDLPIDQEDIQTFLNFIDDKKDDISKNGIDRFGHFENLYNFPGENIDFEYYKKIAVNFDKISDTIINQVFSTSFGNWSTTSIWKRMTFEFDNGESLTIENSDDKPNYMYSPWIVNYKGLILKSNSVLLGRKINELTEGEFFMEKAQETNYALFKIANFLYLNSAK